MGLPPTPRHAQPGIRIGSRVIEKRTIRDQARDCVVAAALEYVKGTRAREDVSKMSSEHFQQFRELENAVTIFNAWRDT